MTLSSHISCAPGPNPISSGEKKRDKFNETYLQVTAEDVPHDAHVVLNVVHGESVHAKELGEQGLAVPLHNVRVILRQICWSTWMMDLLYLHQFGQFEID